MIFRNVLHYRQLINVISYILKTFHVLIHEGEVLCLVSREIKFSHWKLNSAKLPMSTLINFIRWFEELNSCASDLGTNKLEISDAVDVGDRGLIAAVTLSDVKNCLLTISISDPRLVLSPTRAHYLLNQCSCAFSPPWQSTINSHPQNPQDLLTLFFFHLKCSNSDPSCKLFQLWEPYLHVLPETYTDVAFISLTSPELMTKILSFLPSSYRSAFESRIDELKNSFIRLFPDSISPPPFEFAWAWSTVNSRCVYVDLQSCEFGCRLIDEDVKCSPVFLPNSNKDIAIVPFFDFFNHSPDVSADIEVKDGFMYLNSDSKYSTGEQVRVLLID